MCEVFWFVYLLVGGFGVNNFFSSSFDPLTFTALCFYFPQFTIHSFFQVNFTFVCLINQSEFISFANEKKTIKFHCFSWFLRSSICFTVSRLQRTITYILLCKNLWDHRPSTIAWPELLSSVLWHHTKWPGNDCFVLTHAHDSLVKSRKPVNQFAIFIRK